MPGIHSGKRFAADYCQRVTIVEFKDQARHDAWALHKEHFAAKREGETAVSLNTTFRPSRSRRLIAVAWRPRFWLWYLRKLLWLKVQILGSFGHPRGVRIDQLSEVFWRFTDVGDQSELRHFFDIRSR